MQFKNRPDLREHKRQIHGYSNTNTSISIMQTPPTSANDLLHVGNTTPTCSKQQQFQSTTTGNQHFFGQSLDDDEDDGCNESIKQQKQQNVAQLLKDFSNGQVQISHLNGQNNNDAIPSSSSSSSVIYETAPSATSTTSSNHHLNSNIFKCRFCDAKFGDEVKLQYHRAEHVACILGGGANVNGQILSNNDNDLVLKVAHKMIQNNKVKIYL